MDDISNLCFNIKRVNNLVDRILSEIIKTNNAHGGTQGLVLKTISQSKDKSLLQKDLENKFGCRRSTISEIIASLEKDNFIKREVLENDKRINRIYLTQKGIDECLLMDHSIKEFNRCLCTDLNKEEIEVFLKTLNKIENNAINMEEKKLWEK